MTQSLLTEVSFVRKRDNINVNVVVKLLLQDRKLNHFIHVLVGVLEQDFQIQNY